jgi:dolichol-phosphate mannosyltransferase
MIRPGACVGSGIVVTGIEAMGMQPPSISVVTPVYGCRDCLEDLIDRIAGALSTMSVPAYEIILVDDGSPDESWQRILELASTRPWVRGLRLSRNFGQHYAIAAGIEHALGARIVVMDCDLQDPPEEIPSLLAALGGGVEAAFGRRTERNDSAIKRFGSWAFYRLLSWLTGVYHDHATANFGAFERKVIDVVNAMPERERCFPLMVRWSGLRSVAVPVAHAPRARGRSAYDLRRLLRLGSDIILSYSDKPLRLVVRLGLAFSVAAFAMVAVSVFRYLRGDIQVAGFTSVIASIWLVGGVSLFCLGIVGLYVGKQFNDSKGRPYYIVSERTPGAAAKAS